jgi:hypothetical protein
MTTTRDELAALLDDDAAWMLMRALLIYPDESNDELNRMLADCNDDPYTADALDDLRATRAAIAADRELLTDIALQLSLCPIHLIDYAICFDDDDADCAAIRIIHPSHDS